VDRVQQLSINAVGQYPKRQRRIGRRRRKRGVNFDYLPDIPANRIRQHGLFKSGKNMGKNISTFFISFFLFEKKIHN
jgi:hypothetical protein